MKKYRTMIIPFLLVLIAAGLGCNGKKQLCCLEYNYEGDQVEQDEATYCNKHRDAILRFILEVDAKDEQVDRLEQSKVFYEQVMDCASVACIESAINDVATPERLRERYLDRHNAAEQETQLDESSKAGLILCGFDHAIQGTEQTINEE
jgi:hypothetical protein